MSGRNSRIVRNRDRSKNIIDWNSNNAKIIVGISILAYFASIIVLAFLSITPIFSPELNMKYS